MLMDLDRSAYKDLQETELGPSIRLYRPVQQSSHIRAQCLTHGINSLPQKVAEFCDALFTDAVTRWS